MDNFLKNKVRQKYEQLYGRPPEFLVSAPGRINLIGEHTDYSEGFVLPVAINLGIVIALSQRNDHTLHLYSIDFDDHLKLSLNNFTKNKSGWQEYIKGVAWAYINQGFSVQGWQGVVGGNIPIGAGLSSSAALEIAAAKAFSVINNLTLTVEELALLGKIAETDWVGVEVGIMDQLISAAGKVQQALLLDCRSLDIEYVAIPENVGLYVLDTMTRRELSSSEYNTRHSEVKDAAQFLGKQTLRDATLEGLNAKRDLMEPATFKRARHVITENSRVLDFTHAMRNKALDQMGILINESHFSLQGDFAASSMELDLIAELARQQPGCLGSRMIGAGFGGCALALLNTHNNDQFTENVMRGYSSETGIQPNVFKVESSPGVQVFSEK